jgi:tetratricopeptide (TPR) repeat protein
LNPANVEAFYNLGNAYYKAGKYQDALAALNQAIKLQPTHALAHFSRGLVYASLGDKEGVTHDFAILKKLDPALAEKLYNAVKK